MGLPGVASEGHHLDVFVVEEGPVEASAEVHAEDTVHAAEEVRRRPLHVADRNRVVTPDETQGRVPLLTEVSQVLTSQTLNVGRLTVT